jgi:hypothetical protein
MTTALLWTAAAIAALVEEYEATPPPGRSRRLRWTKEESNYEPFYDAFVDFSLFEIRGDAIGDGPEREWKASGMMSR